MMGGSKEVKTIGGIAVSTLLTGLGMLVAVIAFAITLSLTAKGNADDIEDVQNVQVQQGLTQAHHSIDLTRHGIEIDTIKTALIAQTEALGQILDETRSIGGTVATINGRVIRVETKLEAKEEARHDR